MTDRQTDRPTDRQTDHATPSVTICRIYTELVLRCGLMIITRKVVTRNHTDQFSNIFHVVTLNFDLHT